MSTGEEVLLEDLKDRLGPPFVHGDRPVSDRYKRNVNSSLPNKKRNSRLSLMQVVSNFLLSFLIVLIFTFFLV